MNTKIQQLAEQAAEYAVLNYSGEVLQSETGDVKIQIPKEFIEKLSETIIQESVDFLSQAACDYEAEMLRSFWDES